MTEYVHTANGRTWRLYGCAKRGCDAVNPDYLAFGSHNGKSYCLHHVPRRLRRVVREAALAISLASPFESDRQETTAPSAPKEGSA